MQLLHLSVASLRLLGSYFSSPDIACSFSLVCLLGEF